MATAVAASSLSPSAFRRLPVGYFDVLFLYLSMSVFHHAPVYVCVYRYVSVHFCRSWITITCLSTAESRKDPWNRARITNSFLRVNLRCVSLSVHNIQVEPKTDCNSYTNCDVERRSERNTFLYVCYQYAGATKLQTFKTVQFLAHLIYLHCTHHVGSTLFFVLVSLQLFAFIVMVGSLYKNSSNLHW